MKKRKAVVLYGSLTGNTETAGRAAAEVPAGQHMTMLVKLGFQNSETLIFIYYIQPMISHEIIGNLTVGMNTILCAAIERRGVIGGIGLLQ